MRNTGVRYNEKHNNRRTQSHNNKGTQKEFISAQKNTKEFISVQIVKLYYIEYDIFIQ